MRRGAIYDLWLAVRAVFSIIGSWIFVAYMVIGTRGDILRAMRKKWHCDRIDREAKERLERESKD